MTNEVAKLNMYLDWDSTFVDTPAIIPKAYYLMTGVKPVKDIALDWNADTCFPPRADRDAIHKIFDIPLFFELAKQYIFPSALHILYELSHYYNIHIVSCGTESNLKLKEEWCKEYIPFMTSFIGLEQSKKTFDKSSVAKNGVIIDDRLDALLSSENCLRIMFRYNDRPYEWQNGYTKLLKNGEIDHVSTQWDSELLDMLISYHHYKVSQGVC